MGKVVSFTNGKLREMVVKEMRSRLENLLRDQQARADTLSGEVTVQDLDDNSIKAVDLLATRDMVDLLNRIILSLPERT